jgi:protein-S-isoprenylcysteine O-methyltransferase Ste14
VTGQLGLKHGETLTSHARKRWRLAGHLGLNIILALAWGKLALNAYHRWAQTGSLVVLGLVVYNTILVSVTIARRPSVSTSTQIKDWVAALLTVVISMLFRPTAWRQWFAQAAGSILQGVGVVIMVVALASLGRSFGIVAANRGIKRSGLYGWVRHPLYAGELIFFSGFLLTTVSPYNTVVWFGVLCGLVIRSWAEEDHLCQDPEYQAYMKAVPSSFFPKLF